jgi:1,4-dihydroxy-6-naphthoate synthase
MIKAMNKLKEITLAHTLDADDAFMFYALTAKKIQSPNFEIVHVLKRIQELNEAAKQGIYDMSALSFAAYPAVSEQYALLPCGACMGFKRGPMLLSKGKLALRDLAKMRVAIPGSLTTAFLVLKMIEPNVQTVALPFDEIINAVLNDEVDAGLIIHEAQMTFERTGLNKIADLGEWWFEETGLPLPLGGNIVRRGMEGELASELTRMFQESIKYALSNRAEAAGFAMRYARGLPVDQAVQFIGTYVNELTVDYGEIGRKALAELFDRAYRAGAIDRPVQTEFVKC